MNRLRQLDIFQKFDPKFEQDARDRTLVGGLLSFAALALIATLVITEVRYFFSIETRHELFVDNTDLNARLRITLNLTFHEVPCDLVTVDAIDAFGEFQKNIERSIVKVTVDRDGRIVGENDPAADHGTANSIAAAAKIGSTPSKGGTPPSEGANKPSDPDLCSCYGAEDVAGQCCRTCEDIRMAYERRRWHFDVNNVGFKQCAKDRLRLARRRANHEGCRLSGSLQLRRVQGNIHIIPGRMFEAMGVHFHDLGGEDVQHLNLSHTIHELRFGDRVPGLINPLDQHATIVLPEDDAAAAPQRVAAASNDAGVTVSQGSVATGGGATPTTPTTPTTFGGGKFQYFIKVVPTRFERHGYWQAALPQVAANAGSNAAEDGAVETNQYSVTEHKQIRREARPTAAKPGDAQQPGAAPQMDPSDIPGVFIVYELSPIKVRIYEASPYDSQVGHLLLQLCAVGGGVFTVMGLLDAAWYHGSHHVRRKLQMGKFT